MFMWLVARKEHDCSQARSSFGRHLTPSLAESIPARSSAALAFELQWSIAEALVDIANLSDVTMGLSKAYSLMSKQALQLIETKIAWSRALQSVRATPIPWRQRLP